MQLVAIAFCRRALGLGLMSLVTGGTSRGEGLERRVGRISVFLMGRRSRCDPFDPDRRFSALGLVGFVKGRRLVSPPLGQSSFFTPQHVEKIAPGDRGCQTRFQAELLVKLGENR